MVLKTLSGAAAAHVESSFNAASPLQIRLAAKTTGPVTTPIKINVTSAALTTSTPQVTLFNASTINVVLNSSLTGALHPTTAQELVNQLNSLAGSPITAAILYGSPTEPLGQRTVNYSPLTLAGADDVVLTPGYRDLLNGNSSEVVYRFAETLPSDLYRVELFGFDDAASGVTGLKDTAQPPNFYTPRHVGDDRDSINFELDLGPQVISVVPQPITRNVQRVDYTGSTNFTLMFQNQRIGPIAVGASAADVQAAFDYAVAHPDPALAANPALRLATSWLVRPPASVGTSLSTAATTTRRCPC